MWTPCTVNCNDVCVESLSPDAQPDDLARQLPLLAWAPVAVKHGSDNERREDAGHRASDGGSESERPRGEVGDSAGRDTAQETCANQIAQRSAHARRGDVHWQSPGREHI